MIKLLPMMKPFGKNQTKHELITIVKQNDLNGFQEMVLKTWKVRIYELEARET